MKKSNTPTGDDIFINPVTNVSDIAELMNADNFNLFTFDNRSYIGEYDGDGNLVAQIQITPDSYDALFFGDQSGGNISVTTIGQWGAPDMLESTDIIPEDIYYQDPALYQDFATEAQPILLTGSFPDSPFDCLVV